jgi:pyruvate kinase
MVKAGVNSFLLNLAYSDTDQVSILKNHRDTIEAETNNKIPIVCVLKGSLCRVGDMSQPEIFLKKGQEFRIMIKKRIVGNKFICSVDDEELHKKVKPGYKVK